LLRHAANDGILYRRQCLYPWFNEWANRADTGLPLPHMGWNRLHFDENCPLFDGIAQDSHFYFVHSYAVLPNENTIATSHYGVDFSAAIVNKNFYGVQFHPERSGKNGALLLRNFVEKVK